MSEDHDDITKHGYSIPVGYLYIFNLIIGTGVLVLPSVFSDAGFVLATPVVLWLGLVAWITTTFLIEALSISNKLKKQEKGDSEAPFSIDERFEYNDMALILLPKGLREVVRVIMVFYLGGDVAIYTSLAGKTLTGVFCGNPHTPEDYKRSCVGNGMSVAWVYRLAVTTFSILIGSFSYFPVKKTLWLQVFTIAYRWLVLITMMLYGTYHVIRYGPKASPPAFHVHRLPGLVGATVYSFMCHHAIPSLLHPIQDKSKLQLLLLADYVTIACLYIVLPYTAVFTWKQLEDVYTLNFVPEHKDGGAYKFMGYYVSLFPAVVLCSSFPIVCISLQRNLRSLLMNMNRIKQHEETFIVRRLLFPTMALAFFIIAVFCRNVKLLVSLSGNYPGVMVQYLFPALFVHFGRKICKEQFGDEGNPFQSIFREDRWVWIIVGWAGFVFICVTYNTYFWFKEETITNT